MKPNQGLANIRYRDDFEYIPNASIVAIFGILNGVIQDRNFFKFPQGSWYWILTILSVLICIWFYFDKNIKLSRIKPMLFLIFISIYVVTKTAVVSYLYVIGTIHVALTCSLFLTLKLKNYFTLNTLLLIFTLIAVEYNSQLILVDFHTDEVKIVMLASYLITHLFLIFLYVLTSYPKIKAHETDKNFSDLGKSTSFLLHELTRPIQKLQLTLEEKNHSFLNELTDTLEVAKFLRINNLSPKNTEVLNIERLWESIVANYKNNIDFYKIQIHQTVSASAMIHGNTKLTKLIFGNLLRNAIDATKAIPEQEERVIDFKIEKDQITLSNYCLEKIDCSKIFESANTEKSNNMELDLFLINTLCKRIDWGLEVKCIPHNQKYLFSISLIHSTK